MQPQGIKPSGRYVHPTDDSVSWHHRAQMINRKVMVIMPLLCIAFCIVFLVVCLAHEEPRNEHQDYEIQIIDSEGIVL